MFTRLELLERIEPVALKHGFRRKGEKFIKENEGGIFDQELSLLGGKGQHFKIQPGYDLVAIQGRCGIKALAYLSSIRRDLEIQQGHSIGYYNNLFTDTDKWIEELDQLLGEVNKIFNPMAYDRSACLKYFTTQRAFTDTQSFILAVANSA